MIKYFTNCRKSTEEEVGQVLSIEAQLTELREYAKKEGLLIVKEFTENQTAKEPGRPYNDVPDFAVQATSRQPSLLIKLLCEVKWRAEPKLRFSKRRLAYGS